ncbi:MAG: hypothetical protein HYS27_09650 [Deltaproteobacteria bacterium]|nr:hypothetical protein [Deltaproteobacteria bacterium]
MKDALLVVVALVVAAAIGLPLGQLMMTSALACVVSGAVALVVSAREWSGKLFTIGIGLAVLGSFWNGLSFQLRRLLHDPTAVALVVLVTLAAIAFVLARTRPHGSRAKAPTPRARERAHLVEPDDGPSKVPPAASPDDLGLFGPRHD